MNARDKAAHILTREIAGHHDIDEPDILGSDFADALDAAGLLAHEPDELADVWDEGHGAGVWNTEHEAMIERGNREAIRNPYREDES